jgi:hypothetical protein
MHPLISAIARYRSLIGIEPRSHGLYWPMWKAMEQEEREFIRALGFGQPLISIFR